MNREPIAIKFNKDVIQGRTKDTLLLKPSATQDNFLNQFRYRSIVSDAMLSPTKKINRVNYESLVGICYIPGTDDMPAEEKERLAKKMAAYDFVEYAYVPGALAEDPIVAITSENNRTQLIDIPDFTSLQRYKNGVETDHIGIDMEYAWSLGVKGQGIRCAVFENGFNAKHVNLKRDSLVEFFKDRLGRDNKHGTAVAGILYANDIGTGMKGMVYGADTFYVVLSENNPNPNFPDDPSGKYIWPRYADSLLQLYQHLDAGDVISISQAYVTKISAGPIDIGRVLWDTFKTGTEAGIIICCGAGNESVDFDNNDEPEIKDWKGRPDIGIIHVGAGDEYGHPADFTSYGKMIDLQGWGTNNVATTGWDGDLYDDGVNTYTDDFSGTSAATPMVASAVVAVQSWYKQHTGKVLSPVEMRKLLVETGTPQADPANKHIGPIPNIRNAIAALQTKR